MKKQLTIFILAIPMLCIGQMAYARNYIVEIIVFEHTGNPQESDEVWEFSTAKIAKNLDRIANQKSAARIFETSATLYGLKRVRQKMSSAGYRILRAARWVQPARSFKNASVVSIGIENSVLPNGFIKVYKTSLIFVDLDLQLSPPVFETTRFGENTAPQQPHYFISEKRRLKFREIHYFDHPKFGAILAVWPAG